MRDPGHFDFESQTWVRDGSAPLPPRVQEPVVGATRRKRGSAELFLLIGGVVGAGLGILLLLISAGTGAFENPAVSAGVAATGGWLLQAGIVLLFILLVINAFVDVWQRRMRDPE